MKGVWRAYCRTIDSSVGEGPTPDAAREAAVKNLKEMLAAIGPAGWQWPSEQALRRDITVLYVGPGVDDA